MRLKCDADEFSYSRLCSQTDCIVQQ